LKRALFVATACQQKQIKVTGSQRSSIARRPALLTPMAAQVVKQLPDGPEWLYELEPDGHRALLLKDQQRIELRSRKNKDLSAMHPAITLAGKRLKADQAVIDGEIVALDAEGRTVVPSSSAP
jgi:bifunctional non-homologous end joining protein LigD